VDKFVAGFRSHVREFFQVPPPAIVHDFPATFLAGFLSRSEQRPRVSFSPCALLGFGLPFPVPSSIHHGLGSVQRAGPESSFGIGFTGRPQLLRLPTGLSRSICSAVIY
jgi:hypothetical protein